MSNVYIKDTVLFGDDEWVPIKPKTSHSMHLYFGDQFVNNLVINEEKQTVELIEHAEIDKVYYSAIVSAEYYVSASALNKSIIEGENNKMRFMKNAKKYSFVKIEEIAFVIPKKSKGD